MTAGGVEAIEALLGPFRAEPGAAAILSDLDGTLAPIVDDPGAAAVPAQTRSVLARLGDRFALVACVTGRRALEARRIVGVDALLYAGNHGLELLRPGAHQPEPAPQLRGRESAAAEFVAGLDLAALQATGIAVEDKGPIQALHWRRAADPGRAEEVAAGVVGDAEAAGLVPRLGRRVLELRPLATVDKGAATRSLVAASGVELALFGGDDRTDLDAFAALGELASSGALRVAARVGVDSDEAPADLAERSDVVVAGTHGFLHVLRLLADEV